MKHMRRAGWLIIGLVLFLSAFILCLSVHRAHAHDHAKPDLNDWMKGLHSANKTWCCRGDDHDPIDAWEANGKSYRVKFRGEWFDVPESALVDGPNMSGDALLWMNKGWSGQSVRCFMPGTLG